MTLFFDKTFHSFTQESKAESQQNGQLPGVCIIPAWQNLPPLLLLRITQYFSLQHFPFVFHSSSGTAVHPRCHQALSPLQLLQLRLPQLPNHKSDLNNSKPSDNEKSWTRATLLDLCIRIYGNLTKVMPILSANIQRTQVILPFACEWMLLIYLHCFVIFIPALHSPPMQMTRFTKAGCNLSNSLKL